MYVVYTSLRINRSQHAFGFLGTFNHDISYTNCYYFMTTELNWMGFSLRFFQIIGSKETRISSDICLQPYKCSENIFIFEVLFVSSCVCWLN